MAQTTPQFNIKTGADSSTFFSREVTGGDSASEASLGLIKDKVITESDVFNYPVLVRRTGDSIKGSTESIESNELRPGRTKSAPRKGNSSSEGNLDFELSPETYDDMLEATLRNEWKEWKNDNNSETNLDHDSFAGEGYGSGEFATKIKPEGKAVLVGPTNSGAIIETDVEGLEIHELSCGTKDIKYSILKKFGGNEGEDLFQEFQHLAVNTMSLSVSPGEIVTGSFGVMGSNNPDLVGTEVLEENLSTRFLNTKSKDDVKEWIKNLPKKGTSTDQYTAREGFLYINEERVRYGSSLEFELNNGLNKTFAIFEKDAIATSPLSLDVTGTLGAYLIKGHSEKLYNLGTKDKDVQVFFTFQEKEENPENLYAVQIFKSKFTDNDMGSGAETLEVSFPFQSFEERACRIFRMRKRRPIMIDFDNSEMKVVLSTSDKNLSVDKFEIKAIVDGVDVDLDLLGVVAEDRKSVTFTVGNPIIPDVEDKEVKIFVTYNGQTLSHIFTIQGTGVTP